MAKKEDAFLVQINYKSGISVTMPFKDFQVTIKGGARSFNWVVADPTHRPLFLNVDEVESIYQVGLAK